MLSCGAEQSAGSLKRPYLVLRRSSRLREEEIALLAKALGVTPGFLMGWEDEVPAQQAREELAEDPDRKALLNLARFSAVFSALSPER